MSDPQEREYDYRKQRYEAYSKEREGLRAAALEVSGRYDRWMLFLAGGGLALSITFIEKIAPHPPRWSFALLLIAWVLLVLSLFLELHALGASHTAVQEQIDLLDEEYRQFLSSISDGVAVVSKTPVVKTGRENEFIFRTRMLNKWALRSLIAGIIFLCLFSAVNLPYSKVMAESQREIAINASKGSFIPPHNILPPPPPPSVTTAPPPPVPASAPATPSSTPSPQR